MSKKMIVCIALLLFLTGIVAIAHLRSQETITCMEILQQEQRITVSFEDLNQGTFSGELIDGKGDVTFHEYTGILLKELLERKNIDLTATSGVTITSADNYSVEFTADELLQTDKIYVAITVDGMKIEGIKAGTEGVQVIVFGDPNSHRCVRFAQRITIEMP